jgi:ABC-type oligopeptide transport system ATPase subunit
MLDVSIRLEILNLLAALKRERNLAMLYVTHDLATARHFSTEIMVMYRGEIVERGPSDEVILSPAHPYTQLLAAAAPNPTAPRAEQAAARSARQTARAAQTAEPARQRLTRVAGSVPAVRTPWTSAGAVRPIARWPLATWPAAGSTA